MEMMNLTENVLMIFRRIANALETMSGKKHEIDWEQRRYEIAREMLSTELDVERAVEIADELIEKLKNANN